MIEGQLKDNWTVRMLIRMFKVAAHFSFSVVLFAVVVIAKSSHSLIEVLE